MPSIIGQSSLFALLAKEIWGPNQSKPNLSVALSVKMAEIWRDVLGNFPQAEAELAALLD